jgi:hypothetical protein
MIRMILLLLQQHQHQVLLRTAKGPWTLTFPKEIYSNVSFALCGRPIAGTYTSLLNHNNDKAADLMTTSASLCGIITPNTRLPTATSRPKLHPRRHFIL